MFPWINCLAAVLGLIIIPIAVIIWTSLNSKKKKGYSGEVEYDAGNLFDWFYALVSINLILFHSPEITRIFTKSIQTVILAR